MKATVHIELTAEQKQKLWGMQDQIAMACETGEPALALGQIHWVDDAAVISCCVIPHEQSKGVIEIVSPEYVGKYTDTEYKLERLMLARASRTEEDA